MSNRVLELALAALTHQRAQIEAEIELIQARIGNSLHQSANPSGRHRKRTAAEKEEQRAKLKAYWAKKKVSAARETAARRPDTRT